MYLHYFIIFLGGGLGSVTRVLFTRLLPTSVISVIPLQILCVNVIGCFLMGLLTALMKETWTPNAVIRSLLTTGFLGGFTTFSAFSLDFGLLIEKRIYGYAFLYVLSTVTLSLLAFFVGLKIIK